MDKSIDPNTPILWFPIWFLLGDKIGMKGTPRVIGPNGQVAMQWFADEHSAERFRKSLDHADRLTLGNINDAQLLLESIPVFRKVGFTHAVLDYSGTGETAFFTLDQIEADAKNAPP